MNSISKYILDYLITYQRVEVAGFGAFFLVNTSAKVSDDNSILPPAKKIHFEFDENIKDNGFAKFISQNADFTTETALKYIKQNAEEWLVKIKNHLPLKVEGIGVFTHFDNKLSFAGERIDSLTPDFFGLEMININTSHIPNNEGNTFWSSFVLWVFLFVIPIVGLIAVGILQKDKILGKTEHSIQNGTNRIE